MILDIPNLLPYQFLSRFDRYFIINTTSLVHNFMVLVGYRWIYYFATIITRKKCLSIEMAERA